MKQDGLTLASTLAARICHDLAGTLGALVGTLEMAAAGDEPDALELAVQCGRELSAKLRLLRVAWSDDAEVPDLTTLLAGLPGADRLTVEVWDGWASMSEARRQLAVNLLMLAAAGLPRGGCIQVASEGVGLSIEIEGPRAGWPPALRQCLAGGDALRSACTRSRDVGIAFACLLADQIGVHLSLRSDTQLSMQPH